MIQCSRWLREAAAFRESIQTIVGEPMIDPHIRKSHPIYNFIFTYYPRVPRTLRHWTPGTGVTLEIPRDANQQCDATYQYYLNEILPKQRRVVVGSCMHFAQLDSDKRRWRRVLRLLQATHIRPPNFSCFNMHEWAMLYQPADEATAADGDCSRFQAHLPLRVSQATINRTVENWRPRCSHFDAFRHFTPRARPLNKLPTRAPSSDDKNGHLNPSNRDHHEQPGCLHANMDLLKWCGVLFPLLPSAFVLRALRLAIWARTVDMRASPYDLAHWFHSTQRMHTLPVRAIAIETVQGRSEYAQEQRKIFETANNLRADMIRFMCGISDLDH